MALRVCRLLFILWPVLLLTACNPPDVATPLSEMGNTTETATMAGAGLTALTGRVQLAEAPPDGHAGIVVFLGGTGFQARTDLDGAYLISGVPPGEYKVFAEKAGYQTLEVERITLDLSRHSPATPAAVRPAILEKAGGELDSTTTSTAALAFGSISGMAWLQGVDDSDGIRVQLEGTPHVTVTDRDGSYQLVNVPPGTYTIAFSHPGFRSFDTQVQVRSGERAVVDDTALENLSRGAQRSSTAGAADPTATGTLLRDQLSGNRSILGLVEIVGADGTPVAEYDRVTVALDNSDVVVTPDGEGKFRIPDLPPGVYKVTAAIDGQADSIQSQIADLTNTDSAQVTFRFGPGAAGEAGTGGVRGRVLLAAPPTLPGVTESEAPQPGVGVSAGLSNTQLVVLTGADGAFVFDEVPAGSYSLILSKEGYEEQTVSDVEVVAGQMLDLGEVTMEPKLERPRVISTSPEQGARNVMVLEVVRVIIDFSKKMNRESVLRSLRVEPAVPFTPYIGNGSHSLADDDTLVLELSNLNPQQPIQYNTTYRVTILSAAMDQTGVAMGEEFALRFTMGGVGVASTYPADGAVGAIVNQENLPVQIVFNGPIDPQTLNKDTIKIRPDHNISYRVDSYINPSTGFTTAHIATTYDFDTNYTVTVTRRVRTTRRQPLSNTPYTFSFRSQAPQPVPYVDQVTGR